MTDSERSPAVETLIYIGLGLAFVDETVRKSIPGAPILVTAVKDVVLIAAGFLIILQTRGLSRTYGKYFAPWVLVTFVSGLWVFTWFHSLLLLGATIRSYCLMPLLFAVGYYLGVKEEARRRVTRIFLIGGLLVIAVAVAQEFAREALPSFLSTRIYRVRHGGAGGDYNESLFASPQTLSHVAVVLAAWSFTSLVLPGFSRRRFSPLGLLLLGLIGVYLSRIRTALLILVMVLFIIWLGVWKVATRPGQMPAPLRGLVVALVILVLGSACYVAIYSGLKDMGDEDLARDILFYERALDFETIKLRSGLFLLEFQTSGEHDWFFGNGAGTGGRMRGFVDIDFHSIPAVSDTGLYLLYHEMGMVGLVSFLVCFGALLLRCALFLSVRPTIPPVALPTFALGAALLLWFLFKSHTCIANGFTRIIWMGSMGICCAALDRQRQAESGEPGPVQDTAAFRRR